MFRSPLLDIEQEADRKAREYKRRLIEEGSVFQVNASAGVGATIFSTFFARRGHSARKVFHRTG